MAKMFTQKLMANNEQCMTAHRPVFANNILFGKKMVSFPIRCVHE